ncbi:hypothetical protein [Sphingobium olei]|uniref:Uncharacterized protein n=1 Tax=Sphingobium olei TaxID=420955 RepID=A0ABW3P4L1_9SPHN|nr:hypothetical protein [Sphingobium sp.]
MRSGNFLAASIHRRKAGYDAVREAKNLSAWQVVGYLEAFIDGTDGDWDWDNFTTIPIADPRLDNIRDRVAALDVPLSNRDIPALTALLAEAKKIAAEDHVKSSSYPSSSRP